MLILELLGTFFGAGFASGREIASFFARYGVWGYGGAVLSCAVLCWLVNTDFPESWQGSWPVYLWKALNLLLYAATGGAMLSAAGETAQLVIPIQASYWLGMCLSLILSWLLAFHIRSGLAWTSMVMLVVYIFVVAAGLYAQQVDGAVLYKPLPIAALSSGLCYSGFNAALLLPVVRRSSLCPAKKRRDIFLMSILSMGFLAAGIVVFQRNPGIIDAPMPFVKLLNRFGIWGYLLSACCLYTAELSTLTSCLRMLGRSVWSIGVIILVASLGFTRIVDLMYTTLGGACALIILMAKFRNCSRKAFISSSDML